MTASHSTYSGPIHEEPWGEQHFPAGLSENAPERSTHWKERATWQVRLNPWRALGIAASLGLLAGLLATNTLCGRHSSR